MSTEFVFLDMINFLAAAERRNGKIYVYIFQHKQSITLKMFRCQRFKHIIGLSSTVIHHCGIII